MKPLEFVLHSLPINGSFTMQTLDALVLKLKEINANDKFDGKSADERKAIMREFHDSKVNSFDDFIVGYFEDELMDTGIEIDESDESFEIGRSLLLVNNAATGELLATLILTGHSARGGIYEVVWLLDC